MLPYAYPAGLGPDAVVNGTLSMPANGGTIIVPFVLPDQICIQQMSLQTADLTLAHTLEFVFFEDETPLAQRGMFQAFTYTAAGVAVRTGNLAQPVYLGPGLVWLVLRNAGANATLLGAVGGGTLGGNLCAVDMLGQSLSNGLNNPSWSPIDSVPLVRLGGSLRGVFPGATI